MGSSLYREKKERAVCEGDDSWKQPFSPPRLWCRIPSSRDAANTPAASGSLCVTIRGNSRPFLHPGTALPGPPYVCTPRAHTMPSQHCLTRNDGCRMIVICFPSLLHWENGREGKRRYRGWKRKPGKTRTKGDTLTTKGGLVWGLNVTSLLCIVLQAFLRISSPVSSVSQTHRRIPFSSQPAEQLPQPEVRAANIRRKTEWTHSEINAHPDAKFTASLVGSEKPLVNQRINNCSQMLVGYVYNA